MIEPARFGGELMEEVRTTEVRSGEVALWRLGQAGVAIKFPSATLYVDLYLSNYCQAVLPPPFDHRRATRSPLDPAEVTDADLVVCTHEHLDHLDPPTLRTLSVSSPEARVVAPATARQALLDLWWPEERIVSTRVGETYQHGGIEICPVPGAHENFDEDPKLGHPYQGYFITDGAATVYHAGDTVAHDAVVERLRGHEVDAAFLPINGRSEERARIGFAGNMNAGEAVEFASKAGLRRIVPVHCDMFPQNTDPGCLARFESEVAKCDELESSYPCVGERLIVRCGGSLMRPHNGG